MKSRRRLSTATLATGMIASSAIILSPMAATAAPGDVNVVPDTNLQACLNVVGLSRAADIPITTAELNGVTTGVSGLICDGSYAPISSLEGMQHLTNVESVNFTSSLHLGDLTPIAAMPNLSNFSVQGYLSAPTVIDLTQLADAADTLTKLGVLPADRTPRVERPDIQGLELFTGLTQLSVPFGGQDELVGVSALTALNELYGTTNILDGADLAALPRNAYFAISLSSNLINDFSGLPDPVTQFIASTQRHISDEPILFSADAASTTTTPVDRVIAWAGGTATLSDGVTPDAGPLTFQRDQLRSADQLQASLWFPYEPQFDLYASYDWRVSSTGKSASGRTFFPVVEVDQVDNAALAVSAFDDIDLDFVEVQYSDAGAGDLFAPVSYLLSGVLPEGLTLDPSTGRLSGTTTQTGSFTFTVDAADAEGITTTGTYTLTVSPLVVDVPPAPPVDDPTGPDNATWVLPADTDYIAWVEENGDLIAVAQPGVVFANGETRINFGSAPDDYVAPGPEPEPEVEEAVKTSGPLATTGADMAPLLLAGGAGIVAIGVGALLALRRRRLA